MLSTLRVLPLVLALLLCAGCSSTDLVVIPSNQQAEETRRTTRGGFDYLQSDLESSTVTASLRSATGQYVQLFMAVYNKAGSGPITVVPSSIRVRVVLESGEEETLYAYSEDDVPGVLAQQAVNSEERISQLASVSTAINSNYEEGSFIYAQQKRGASQGAYGSQREEETTLEDVLITETLLNPETAINGLVYAPFRKNAKQVIFEVPLGDETHVFQYNLRREAS